MSSAFFLKTPTTLREKRELRAEAGKEPLTPEQEDLWSGEVIRDGTIAVMRFLEAVQTEEWAELKWSS